MAEGTEGPVAAFPTPEELWNRTFAEENDWRDRSQALPFPDKGGSWQIRYYQEIAVERVLERVAQGADRILLTLATGTGKTSIAFQIAWKLFQTRWNLSRTPTRRPRILLLADRNTLANQAFNDFNSFAAFEDKALVRVDPEEIRKKGRVPKNASVFFTIFQTFMTGKDAEGKPRRTSASIRPISSISSSSMSAIAAARTMRARGGTFLRTSSRPCSSA